MTGKYAPGFHAEGRILDRFAEQQGIGALTDAEIVITRERLGLSQVQLARQLGVTSRAVERWERGERAISNANFAVLFRLSELQDAAVRQAIEALRPMRVGERTFIVYRSDAHLGAHHSNPPFPASWIRAIAARVVAEADFHVDVVFAPEHP